MSDLQSVLRAMRERLDGITPGPWRTWKDDDGRRGAAVETAWAHDADGADTELITDWCSTPDAVFIAAAPTDIARLLDAVQAVTGLHKPQEEDQLWCILDEECEECYPECGEGTGHAMTVCSECRAKVDDVTGFIPWPCPTIAALSAALGGGKE